MRDLLFPKQRKNISCHPNSASRLVQSRNRHRWDIWFFLRLLWSPRSQKCTCRPPTSEKSECRRQLSLLWSWGCAFSAWLVEKASERFRKRTQSVFNKIYELCSNASLSLKVSIQDNMQKTIICMFMFICSLFFPNLEPLL